MQIFGDGPIKMLVVQCSSDLSMRATAKLSGERGQHDRRHDLDGRVAERERPRPLRDHARPADKQPGQQPYQSIVPLSGVDGPLKSMAEVLEHYMHHSEQLDTRLWLAANTERAVGMLLQKLPGDGGIVPHPGELDADTWERVCTLGRHAVARRAAEGRTGNGVPTSVLAGERSAFRAGHRAFRVHLLARKSRRRC